MAFKQITFVCARMSALTANVVVGQPADCAIFWLQIYRSSRQMRSAARIHVFRMS